MSKAKINQRGGDMRKTLAILVASVLLVSSFTFSSCKDCGKKKNKPAGREDKISSSNNGKIPDNSTAQVPVVSDNSTPSTKPLTPEEKEKELEAQVHAQLMEAAKAVRAIAKRWYKPEEEKDAETIAEVEAIAEITKSARDSTNLNIANDARAIELLAKYATWLALEQMWQYKMRTKNLNDGTRAAFLAQQKVYDVYDNMRNEYPNALCKAKDAYEKVGGRKGDLERWPGH
jgi:hypothetical protein